VSPAAKAERAAIDLSFAQAEIASALNRSSVSRALEHVLLAAARLKIVMQDLDVAAGEDAMPAANE
jgi:hypothetical protein